MGRQRACSRAYTFLSLQAPAPSYITTLDKTKSKGHRIIQRYSRVFFISYPWMLTLPIFGQSDTLLFYQQWSDSHSLIFNFSLLILGPLSVASINAERLIHSFYKAIKQWSNLKHQNIHSFSNKNLTLCFKSLLFELVMGRLRPITVARDVSQILSESQFFPSLFFFFLYYTLSLGRKAQMQK